MRILTGASVLNDEIHWIGTGFDSPGFTDSGDADEASFRLDFRFLLL